jgi:ABC-type polysaccharide/polyol phosphate transport system ATPase subunit
MNLSTDSNPATSDDFNPQDGVVVNIEGVSVQYRIRRNRPGSLKEYAVRWARRDLHVEHLLALEDVSLQVNAGEVFAIIGRNGAGKTTLLKVIAGILKPTHGRARTYGNTVSLLGVGAGFHSELTGYENVYLYSAVLGRSKARTDELFNAIVEFAELSDFIHAPLRTYSTGMNARLGFAVAMAEKPDILLVDEVLSVGDEQFQEKCRDRFVEFTQSGTTVIIATHGLSTVRAMCQRAVWISNGHIAQLGEAGEIADSYHHFLSQQEPRETIRDHS